MKEKSSRVRAIKEIEVLDIGDGDYQPKTTPDEFRRFIYEHKSKAMVDKRMDVRTAVKKFIKNGVSIAIGGCSFVRLPMAVVHEMIRQNVKNLTMVAGTRTFDLNLLLDNGCIKHLEIGYIVGMEVFGIPRLTRKKVEDAIARGELTINEWDNASMAWRHKAAGMGLPFLPVRNMMGSDGFRRSGGIKIRCPFTGEELVLVPAIYTDVAVVHVHEADIYGNCRIYGAINEDWGKMRGAKRLIITTERIIDTDEIRREPEKTFLPYFYVDAVVEVPYGAHPTNMPKMYYLDIDHIKEYMNASRDPSGKALKEYYEKYIFGVDSFEEYLEKIGGKEKLKYLEDLERQRKNVDGEH